MDRFVPPGDRYMERVVGGRFFGGRSGRHSIRIGQKVEVDLRVAQRWRPPKRVAWDADTLRERLARLALTARRFGPSGTMIELVPDFARGGVESINETVSSDPMLMAAVPGVAALESWVPGSGQQESLLRGVRSLVGLGRGLTPSGDDFLGGVMISLRYLGEDEDCRKVDQPYLSGPVLMRETGRLDRPVVTTGA